MSTLLINANQPEEIRVALLIQEEDKSQKLWDLYIENTLKQVSLKNIYAGVGKSVEFSLEAAFIDYGAERHGFLPFKEVASNDCKGSDRQHIKTPLKVGQPVMVQIKKEVQGSKGAALTTYITLPGSYLVLMPNNAGGGGISRRIKGAERREMQQTLDQLELPKDMGLILRTAGVGRSLDALETDLTLLLRQWEAIMQAFQSKPAPFLIFQESDIIARAIRDYLREDIHEILVDDVEIFEKTKAYTAQIRPDLLPKLRLYQEIIPLFLKFGIEEEVESAFQPMLRLPSGGTIVFNRFEAFVAIDINSGGSTKHKDIEETALKTNLEAAEVIARHLRLRDLGGLIVIDFIDMAEESHKRQVENRLRKATQSDRARIKIGRISSFGLLEMSRQRLRASLGKVNEDLCTYCQGHGTRRSIESLALAVIRAVEKQALRKTIRQLWVESSVDLATYLVNEKRAVIAQLEQRYQLTILLLPNRYWETARYHITSFTSGELPTSMTGRQASYTLLSNKPYEVSTLPAKPITSETPAVQRFGSELLAQAVPKLGIFARLFVWFKNLFRTKKHSQPTDKKTSSDHYRRRMNTHKRPLASDRRHYRSGGANHRLAVPASTTSNAGYPNFAVTNGTAPVAINTPVHMGKSPAGRRRQEGIETTGRQSSRTANTAVAKTAVIAASTIKTAAPEPRRMPHARRGDPLAQTPVAEAKIVPPVSRETMLPVAASENLKATVSSPSSTMTTTATTTKPTTLKPRAVMRRFGGEPKLRGRSYAKPTYLKEHED